MMMLSSLVFAAAFGVALAVILGTIAPQWRRILHVAAGGGATFQPLRQLAYAERRIAVRRWSSATVTRSIEARLRDAA